MKCQQIISVRPGGEGKTNPCPNEATARFTWPGRPESRICDACLPRLRRVAVALGLELVTMPITVLDEEETQMVALALGVLLVRSPGFDFAVTRIATKLGCVEAVEEFRRLNADDPRLAPRGDS